jgi:hypothetical protein
MLIETTELTADSVARRSSGSVEELLSARLASVDLSIESGSSLPEDNKIDYREKIKYFLEYQKIKLVSLAVSSGENE